MKPTPQRTICPKCGYDQSGEIATWQTQCPMTGVCPECGLGFDWADVFDPGRVHLAWYVEHTERKIDMLKRSPKTFWFLLVPNRFWKRVTVTSPIYTTRLWSSFAILTIMCYLFVTLLDIASSAYKILRWNQLYASFQAQNPGNPSHGNMVTVDMGSLQYWLANIGSSLLHPIRSSFSATQTVLLLTPMVLIWAVIIAAVPTTRRIARIRVAHAHRAFAWSGFAIVLMYSAISASEAIASVFMTAGRGLDPNWHRSMNVVQLRFSQARAYSQIIAAGVFLATFLWIQWFWIAAYIIGWRIRSIVLLLLTLIASLLAGFTASVYISVH